MAKFQVFRKPYKAPATPFSQKYDTKAEAEAACQRANMGTQMGCYYLVRKVKG